MTFKCSTHNEKRATGGCQICEQTFCESCLKAFRKILLCEQHHQLAQKANWISIKTIELSSDRPEDGIRMQQIKETLWNEKSLPAYILTHYRINIEKDLIESHMNLYVRQEDKDLFKEKIEDQA